LPAIPFQNISIKGSTLFTPEQLTSLITVSRATLEEYVFFFAPGFFGFFRRNFFF
jgi:hypothetical protein